VREDRRCERREKMRGERNERSERRERREREVREERRERRERSERNDNAKCPDDLLMSNIYKQIKSWAKSKHIIANQISISTTLTLSHADTHTYFLMRCTAPLISHLLSSHLSEISQVKYEWRVWVRVWVRVWERVREREYERESMSEEYEWEYEWEYVYVYASCHLTIQLH